MPKLTNINDFASDKPFKLPEDLRDIQGLLKAVPDTDRTSIRTFQRLYELSSTRDALTKALVLAMLRQAVAAEQELSA